MSFSDKSKNRKYKSDFGSIGQSLDSVPTKSKETSSKKEDDYYKSSSSSRRKNVDEEEKKSSSKSRRGEESQSRKERDRDEEKTSSRHRSRPKEETNGETRKSHHRKIDGQEDEQEDDRRRDHHRSSKHRENRENDNDEKRRDHHRSSKHRDEGDDDKRKDQHRSSKTREDRDDDSRKHREHKSERRKHKEKEESDRDEKNDEPNYEDDFDDDFEKDESDKEERKRSMSEKKSEKKFVESDEDDEDYKASRRREKEKEKSSSKSRSDRDRYSSRNKFDDYDDYDEENEHRRGRIVKANAQVNLPTELVEAYSSEIHFNHDSRDRQRRRAKDLFKNLIELDKKAFSLLDINPVQMRTVYLSHLKHEKVQTNDDTLEIEAQTDEIEMTTRWTQHPADDIKGYGIEDQKFNYDVSNDILEQFRTDINVASLQKFLQKSSKVIETLLKENESNSGRKVLAENKSDLEFSQGYSVFSMPKFLSKIAKTAVLTSVVFAQDDINRLVCSYDMQLGFTNSTLLLVWDIEEPTTPYRALICETVSTCLCYFSFIVVSGNIDGSIVLWDLREPASLHSRNLKKIGESNVIRSPTYTTAGVLQQENHMSEVKSILPLQSQGKEDSKDVFMQLTTLEVDCKLIIWTVVELKNVDLSVFETDLGLLPGGKVKLSKSYEISLNNIIKTSFGRGEYQTWNMATSTEKKNHFFISTNLGQIIHIERKGKSFSRSVMKSSYTDVSRFVKVSVEGPDLSPDGLLTVKNVSFHHDMSDLLLATYGNGEIRLYDVNYAMPIKTWLFMLGTEIKEAKWIESRSSCFLVVDQNESKMFIWDLLQDDIQPVLIRKLKNYGDISFSRAKSKETEQKDGPKVPFAYFDQNSTDLQVHLFAKDWTQKSDKEAKKFAKLIKTYLLIF